MSRPRVALIGSLVSLLTAVSILSGCSNGSGSRATATLPTQAGLPEALSRARPSREPGLFYPLVPGNHWSYVLETYTEIRPLGDTTVFRGSAVDDIARSIDCPSDRVGFTWRVQTDRYRERGGPPVDRIDWTRLRQDRTGLFELEVIPTDPYPCGPLLSSSTLRSRAVSSERLLALIADPRLRRAAAGALARLSGPGSLEASISPRLSQLEATTLVRLRYPLRPGATWAIRPETDSHGVPTFSAEVEARETLTLPAGRFRGYRIRLHSPFFGPEDSIVVWYGRAGFLAMDTRQAFLITDESGNVLGTGMSTQRERLTGVNGALGIAGAETDDE